MNIDPLSNSGGPIDEGHGPVRRNGETSIQPAVERDSISVERSMRIESAMARIPEIRPEVVERGRQLLADPNYPGLDIIQKMASLIVPFDEID